MEQITKIYKYRFDQDVTGHYFIYTAFAQMRVEPTLAVKIRFRINSEKEPLNRAYCDAEFIFQLYDQGLYYEVPKEDIGVVYFPISELTAEELEILNYLV
jgi:hypothetical protein